MTWGKVWVADPKTLTDDELEEARRAIQDSRPATAAYAEYSRRDARLRALETERARRRDNGGFNVDSCRGCRSG